MSPSTYTRIVLNERPKGNIVPNTFRKESAPFDFNPASDEILVKVTWISLDPAMRSYLSNARSYVPPVQIGQTMRALGLGVVIKAGSASKFSVSQTVVGSFGWTEYAIAKDKDVSLVAPAPGIDPLDYLNVIGPSGFTAYFGIKEVLQLKPGEKLVVSGAAGSVGAIVCQLAKKLGAKVYAIAGSPEKCEWLQNDLGVDKTFNYKNPSFYSDLKAIGFIDAYFDNVGGEILDFVLTRLNRDARIALCGAISAYNGVQYRLKNYLALIPQRAKMQGFIIFDYEDRFPEAIRELSKGLADGSIKRRFHVIQGLENAPSALPMLFTGGNNGKLVVKVSDDSIKAKL